ncbi:glycosyltransferase family 4 protein [Kaistia terrae]|uniref:Glycosyltransferase family 4 protein n=1 Tax=Kaistia terrae TaxID=537017 RepID=A0ABW0PSJ8_9HYPH|nr:glycosyltransferase family 4 protein [Kaistia terrae]MCX5577887.1 glycosyltransferase family 4 protein [Kaistia terrae]
MTMVHRTSSTRVAFIGNSLPRRCGIATFTTDLQQAIAASGMADTAILAMTDCGRSYEYPATVALEIQENTLDDYVAASEYLNRGGFDVVSLQHEFGIFGGEAGSHVIALLARLNMPIITTLHTVLSEPSDAQRRVIDRIIDLSARIVVMAEKGRELLRTIYRVPADKIDVIPHGIPDFGFVDPQPVKAKLGFSDRTVILTFGLLSPNKGIEVMIDAMPQILESRADAVYVVLGATHPNLVRDHGEAYRDSLLERARHLGVEDHVVFEDQFVDRDTLLDYIAMCDVYVTPYLNEAQMTSGTLAYSFGLGKAVVSTPYWHANELLADGRGVLVPFGDAKATGSAIAELLTDHSRREAMRKRAYSSSRSMTWESTARRYLAAFDAARRGDRLKLIAPFGRDVRSPARAGTAPPAIQLGHLLAMCDDTGLFQHAVHSVPDRHHGYCVDDNARALLVACALNKTGEQRLSDALTSRFAAFIQHAWNPDTLYFRNFMSFDRRWLEDRGSEDSHGRTLWSLGEASASDISPSRRQWAASLFIAALPTVERFSSPRAWAFTLLGLEPYCAAFPGDPIAEQYRDLLADRLMSLLEKTEADDWVWFENGLSYDNARLPQALIATGRATRTPAHVSAGLRSLNWLVQVQTSPKGQFRPVGSSTFGEQRKPPLAFDQQPLEATATISACLTAWRADGDAAWTEEARRAFGWFLGENDLSISLVDPETGSCRDGLHPYRANENRGGESVVSYLLSLAEIRQLARLSGDRTKPELRALRA